MICDRTMSNRWMEAFNQGRTRHQQMEESSNCVLCINIFKDTQHCIHPFIDIQIGFFSQWLLSRFRFVVFFWKTFKPYALKYYVTKVYTFVDFISLVCLGTPKNWTIMSLFICCSSRGKVWFLISTSLDVFDIVILMVITCRCIIIGDCAWYIKKIKSFSKSDVIWQHMFNICRSLFSFK